MSSLTTTRLLLRQWCAADLEPFVAMSADPDVMALIGDGSVRDARQAEVSYRAIREHWVKHDFGLFAVERLHDEAFIGFCGLSIPKFLPEILPVVELGWRLRKDAWGQGIGTEAAQAVADWSFETQDQERLVSVIHTDNAASQGLATKLGMTVERRTVVPGNEVWVDVYELERTTWHDLGER